MALLPNGDANYLKRVQKNLNRGFERKHIESYTKSQAVLEGVKNALSRLYCEAEAVTEHFPKCNRLSIGRSRLLGNIYVKSRHLSLPNLIRTTVGCSRKLAPGVVKSY